MSFYDFKMVVFSRQVIPWTAMDCVWERNPDGMPSSQRSNFKREKMQNRSQEVTVALASCKPVSSTCLDRVRLLFDSDLSQFSTSPLHMA